MSDIQHLLTMLQSDNPTKRYEACEELRTLPSLPQEAIEALRLATSDPTPRVAEAAQRALAKHTSITKSETTNSTSQGESRMLPTKPLSVALWIFSSIWVWVVISVVSFRSDFFKDNPNVILLGFVIGVFGQWLILRDHLAVSIWWIPITGLGYVLALFGQTIIFVIMSGGDAFAVMNDYGYLALIAFIGGSAGGIVLGLLQSLALRRQVKQWIWATSLGWAIGSVSHSFFCSFLFSSFLTFCVGEFSLVTEISIISICVGIATGIVLARLPVQPKTS